MTKEIKPDWTIATIKTKDQLLWKETREFNKLGIATYEQMLRLGLEVLKQERLKNN